MAKINNLLLSRRITDLYKVLDIVNSNDGLYRIHYIEKSQWEKAAPKFTYNSKELDLKVEMRDSKIEELLNSIRETKSEFDVEDIIYTPEQREKLESLRNPSKQTSPWWVEIKKVRKEYSESFKLGQKVWYKNAPGIITFKHSDKEDEDLSRWSVKCNDTEFRYVDGTKLLERTERDLSYVPIDPELNKLPTEKLLKIYKSRRKRNKGVGDLRIKRILKDREHIQKGEDKVVITNK